MSGIILIPKTIEQNQEYMFCANVKDDTIIRDSKIPDSYYEDTDRISIAKTTVVLSEKISGDIPNPGNTKYSQRYNTIEHSKATSGVTTTVTDYLKQRGINP